MRKATVSFVKFVCPSAWNNSAPTWRILMKLDIWAFFRNSVEKIQISLKSDKNDGYSTSRRFQIYDIISLNSSYKEKCFKSSCRENQNTHFMFSTVFPKTVPFMRKCPNMWWRQRGFSWQYCGALHAVYVRLHARKHAHTRTHTPKYVIVIAFPHQQWFPERASELRDTYIAFLVFVVVFYVLPDVSEEPAVSIFKVKVIFWPASKLQVSFSIWILPSWCKTASHIHTKAGKIIVYCMLILTALDSSSELNGSSASRISRWKTTRFVTERCSVRAERVGFI